MQYKTENHILFTVVHSDTAAFYATLSGRVRPGGNMPQTPCPVNSRSDMQGFILPLEECPTVLRQDTDTATARTPIPILYIHSFTHPFCGNPLCTCKRTQKDAAPILEFVSEGIYDVQEAAGLIDEGKGERAMNQDTPTGTDQLPTPGKGRYVYE